MFGWDPRGRRWFRRNSNDLRLVLVDLVAVRVRQGVEHCRGERLDRPRHQGWCTSVGRVDIVLVDAAAGCRLRR